MHAGARVMCVGGNLGSRLWRTKGKNSRGRLALEMGHRKRLSRKKKRSLGEERTKVGGNWSEPGARLPSVTILGGKEKRGKSKSVDKKNKQSTKPLKGLTREKVRNDSIKPTNTAKGKGKVGAGPGGCHKKSVYKVWSTSSR